MSGRHNDFVIASSFSGKWSTERLPPLPRVTDETMRQLYRGGPAEGAEFRTIAFLAATINLLIDRTAMLEDCLRLVLAEREMDSTVKPSTQENE